MPSGGRAGAAASAGRARQGGGGVAVWRHRASSTTRCSRLDGRAQRRRRRRASARPSPRDRGPGAVALVPRERGAQPLAPDVPPARRVGAQRGEVAVAEPAATRARAYGSPVPGSWARARAAAPPAASRRCTGSTSQNTAGQSRARTSTKLIVECDPFSRSRRVTPFSKYVTSRLPRRQPTPSSACAE